MAFMYPGIIKVEDGSFEASVSVSGTPGISLGRFPTSESAHMARNGFLESVQMPHNWEESQTGPSPALAAILTGSSSAAPAAPTSVIPPPPSVPHITDSTADLAPPAATEHPQEIPHVSQPSGAEQGMLQQQSFQAMHNEATMHSHVNMQGAHNEPELNRGKRNHGLPKGITRRPNSIKYECKVHLSGKRFYVGLFSTVEEALQAQAEKRQQLVDAASRDPDGKIEAATRTTGEDEMLKVKAAVASGSQLEKVKGLRKRKNGRWETQIMHKGVRHYLGTFDTAEEALDARNKRARELSITEATLPSRSPTAKRAKRAANSPTASPYQGAPAAVPMIAPHVALAYQQGIAPPVVFPGQVPGSKDVVQYQPQMVYHHHPSTAPTSLSQQQQHMQPIHMQQPHVPLPEGAQQPNDHNVSTGVPCSMPQSQQDVQPHELTSLRAMMTNPANVLNMMSGHGTGGLSAGPGSVSSGMPAQLDRAAMQSASSTVNGMPAAIPLPNTPASAQQGGMYGDAGMVPPAVQPPAVPPAPDSLPDAQGTHDIPAPHQSPGMLSQTVPHINHSSGMRLGEMHAQEPPPDAHPVPVDVPAPVSPDEASGAPLVVPIIPEPGDKVDGVAYNGEDPAMHHFVMNSDAEHAQGSFASPAFAGLSSADTHVHNSGEDVSHLIPVPE